ncbi:hypothetical protein E2562_018974 [Oryza meyeriana var. granulata]|uniref:Uncharacterized protein n=1 Tax=Oryza meyeriana var. granulata TaxID=110450 RepID=A0A6G1DJY4_9ORYZ|nr:hypothetical protein E2562_018974 [Oryza meyeriana var. granulata]
MADAPLHNAFLIYDTIRKSLSMIPSEPADLMTSTRLRSRPLLGWALGHRTFRPSPEPALLIACGYEDHESYALALLCKKSFFSVDGVTKRDVLYLWPSSSTAPWEMTKRIWG